ncbi:importin 9 [Brevipalpus obovatus]|uniref:importin 9 n=1 Tax=Brevipalpus obovatus TaxID=246614 RepID=UPI003D9F8DF5
MSASKTLKEALYENLIALRSPDNGIRRNAEQQIKVFEVTNDYGVHLAEMCLDINIDWTIRQLASVLLKHHIDVHWSSKIEKFQEPEISSDAKMRIRSILLNGLGFPNLSTNNDSVPEKKMRGSIAYAISAVAHFDWPEEWPELFQVLVGYLSSGNKGAVNGAMKVFSEICSEISDIQIPTIAPLLLPKMYDIFVDTQNFSSTTRERAVTIFCNITNTITLMNDYDNVAVKHYLDPILPQFTEALVKVLQAPNGSIEVDIGLKKSSLATLTLLVKSCRKKMWKWMPSILQLVWYMLTSSASQYVRQIVNSEAENGQDDSCPVNSDGEVQSLENLIFAIFDFVTVVIETSRSRQLIKQGLPDLLYYILVYMQITDDQIQTWLSNPDRFVEDEDDDSYSYSVRISALDILMSLAKEYEDNESKEENVLFQTALISAIKKHFMESNEAKSSPNNYWWWKTQEACLLAMGSIAAMLMDAIKTNSSPADDIRAILDHCSSITDDISPFFAGRSLWNASIYAPIIHANNIDRFLQTTLNGLLNISPIIKISALRATYNLCVYLDSSNQRDFIKPYLPQILEAAVAIGTQYSTEVLALVLQTIKIIVTVDKQFATSVENKVSSMAIATFLRHSSDPVLISITQDIFKELSKNEECIIPLQQRLIPTLVSILNPNQLNLTVQILQPVAMDILTTIVRNSSTPLGDSLINQCFPAAARCILSTTDDNSTMQNGGECIRAFVSRAVEQVSAFRDPDSGKDGMSIVMQVCLHLLDPRVNESCAAFVGKLIFITIIKGSSYLGNDNTHLLLRSVLSKLQTSEQLFVIQSLIMVFAHLINHHLPTVLDFLSSLPGPMGSQSALEFVLNQWLTRQHLFYGAYESKVSIIALCKLLENSLVNSDQDHRLNLNLILVPGDPVNTNEDSPGMKTRSKTAGKEEKWTMIPCSVKILKLLLNEIYCIESVEDLSENDFDEEEEEDDNAIDDNHHSHHSCENNSPCIPPSQFQDIIDAIESDIDDEEEEDDQDILNDPISKINLGQHLTSFVRSFVNTPYASQFVSHLTENENNILQKISRN